MTDDLSSAIPPVVGWMGADEPFEFDATTLHLAQGARCYELSTMSYASASPHLVSLRHTDVPGTAAQTALARDHSVFTSSRVGGVRVSLHGYNTSTDVRALADALGHITLQR